LALARDAVGRVTLTTDSNTKTTQAWYSNMGWLTKSVNGNNQATTYAYSTAGQLTTLTKPNSKATYFESDQWGGLTKWRQYLYEGEPSAYEIWDHQLRFAYDAAGRTTKKEEYYEQGYYEQGMGWDPHTQITRTTGYAYDNGGILTKIDYPSIADASYGYDGAGGLTKVWDTANSVAYLYDDAGQVTNVAYSYDTGIPVTRTLPMGGIAASHASSGALAC
jgi:YD repeat-containing protein